MSVGVCIINRNGVALAADSAGTITEHKMYYNSMDKIFSLSKEEPYGVITYGNSVIYNVSINQILKEFALYLKNKELLDFFDILKIFTKFIKEKNEYYKFMEKEKKLCFDLISGLIIDNGSKINKIINENDAKIKIKNILDEFENYINSYQKIDNYNISEYIKITYLEFFENELNQIIPLFENFKDEKERLWNLITKYFEFGLQIETNNPTSLCFVGYGKK